MSASAPTLRSLAKQLGLSRTTVSDALRGSPRVDPNTAARVKKAAREAGYRRNPLAGALMSELRRSRGGAFRGVIAAIDFNEPDRPETSSRYHRELVLGPASNPDLSTVMLASRPGGSRAGRSSAWSCRRIRCVAASSLKTPSLF